ncbi:MAG: hypothetical protein ACFE95_02045 [Candidatus Hodarchaeota archaeon]
MDPAEEIRKKQRIKHILAEIVENLRFYFHELQLKKFGQKSRFVVLNDISNIHMVGSKGLNLVTASFNSELGSLTLRIAIKRFNSMDEAMHNKVLTNRLAKKLKGTGVLTPRVIFEHGTTLIYEGIPGESFYDSKIEHEYKLRLAGSALCQYHSGDQRPVDPQRYVFLIKTVLKELQLPQERLQKFIDRAGVLANQVLIYNSGTGGFGDFHPGNILFSVEQTEEGAKRVQTWLIDPEYAEEAKTADRMEDVGTFFLHSAIDLFTKDDNLKAFRNELQPFFEGYNRHLSQYGFSIYEIYKGNHETALSFHLGLNVLLEALFLQKKGNLNHDAVFNKWSNCIALSNYLWKYGIK